jgi:hypothetical protein
VQGRDFFARSPEAFSLAPVFVASGLRKEISAFHATDRGSSVAEHTAKERSTPLANRGWLSPGFIRKSRSQIILNLSAR